MDNVSKQLRPFRCYVQMVTEAGRAVGSAIEVKELNEFLDVLRAKAFGIQKQLITLGLEVTTEEFARHWHGIKEKARMLMEIFQHHNDQVKELIGRQYSLSTHRRYETSLEHTRKFIAEYYKQSDLAVTTLKYQFITDYEFWHTDLFSNVFTFIASMNKNEYRIKVFL